MPSMHPQFHTLNEGIPADTRTKPYIGMDTMPMREGLHVWVVSPPQNEGGPQIITSVNLTRQDAKNLIEEITHRLF